MIIYPYCIDEPLGGKNQWKYHGNTMEIPWKYNGNTKAVLKVQHLSRGLLANVMQVSSNFRTNGMVLPPGSRPA